MLTEPVCIRLQRGGQPWPAAKLLIQFVLERNDGEFRVSAVAGTQATRRMTGMLTRLATILSLARNALIERLNVLPTNG